MENYEVIKEDIGTGKPTQFISNISKRYTKILKYVLGSFGKVCLVKHKVTNRLMVWKMINYGLMKEKEKQ